MRNEIEQKMFEYFLYNRIFSINNMLHVLVFKIYVNVDLFIIFIRNSSKTN